MKQKVFKPRVKHPIKNVFKRKKLIELKHLRELG